MFADAAILVSNLKSSTANTCGRGEKEGGVEGGRELEGVLKVELGCVWYVQHIEFESKSASENDPQSSGYALSAREASEERERERERERGSEVV